MDELNIGQVISILGMMKTIGQAFHSLSPSEIDALNAACNILESNYDLNMPAKDVIKWEYWR